MLFLLHLPVEARSLLHSPLNQETCEFLLQACFECSCTAVLIACGLKRHTTTEEFAHCFGGTAQISPAGLQRIKEVANEKITSTG